MKRYTPILLAVGIFLTVWVIAILLWPKNQINTSQQISNSDCSSQIEFSHHFTDVSTIISIIPPVFRNSRGLMPTTLININGKAPLYMPTSGKLTQGSYHTEEGSEFYMWETDIGCGVTVVFDHVTEPVEKIRILFPDAPRNDSKTDYFKDTLELSAGELVGYTTGSTNAHNWNFAVYDSKSKNYLWNMEEFKNLPKYYTQVCPFDYFNNSMAGEYEKLFVSVFNDITVDQPLCKK